MDGSTQPGAAAARAPRGHGLANRVIPAILRAPLLHRLLSRDLMLITFTGRTSGKRFTTPVTYTPTAAGVAFFSNNRWWTNLRGGAPVTLRLRGRDVAGVATPVEDPAVVVGEIRAYLDRYGVAGARKIGLALDPTVEPAAADLTRAAGGHVVVFVALG